MEKIMQKGLRWAVTVVGVIGGYASIQSVSDSDTRWILLLLIVLFMIIGWTLIAFSSRSRIQAIASRELLLPINEELGDAKEVFLTLHSGSAKRAHGDLLRTSRRLKVVMTHPDSRALDEVSKIANCKREDLASDIRSLTETLVKAGACVGWFDGPIQNSLVIADPSNPDRTWARMEVLIPFAEPVQRPSLKASMRQHPNFYLSVKKAFDELWMASTWKSSSGQS